jgi:phosphoribosyl 1,2-cyclic phosphodiesterase
MGLFTASLNSGSNGNCYYIGNKTDAVLIDVGISCKDVERRLKKLKLNIENVKAIFISHEHGDHIKGLATLANRYHLPIYITNATLQKGPHLIKHLSKPFEHEVPVNIGSLRITPFQKKHDAIDPYSFTISYNNFTVGVFTDIGICCDNVIKHFKTCNAIFLEANYDEQMLMNGRYPIHLKNRIKDGKGHISNVQALQLVQQHKTDKLSHIFLSHLSKENNDEELVKNLFEQHLPTLKIEVATRYAATELFFIGQEKIVEVEQMELF